MAIGALLPPETAKPKGTRLCVPRRATLLPPIHPSAQKVDSTNFAKTAFSKVRMAPARSGE